MKVLSVSSVMACVLLAACTATPTPAPEITAPATAAPTATIQDTSTPAPTSTLAPTSTPTAPPTETPTGTPTPTERIGLPMPWPLQMPSKEQIEEARTCDLEALSADRYPDSISLDDLPASYHVVTPCDWAVLAAAYAARAQADEGACRDGQIAWAHAVSRNAAYALTEALYGFLVAPDAVAAPAFAHEPLAEVAIHYSWSGMGESVEYDVSITDADVAPHAAGVVNGEQYPAGGVAPEAVQALSESLTGFVPAGNANPIVICADNYPDWTIVLTYQSGRRVELATNHSNVCGLGGPWWMAIDGQLYVQFSNAVPYALLEITDALHLPLGEPGAMACKGLDSSLLDTMFAEPAPELQ